MKIRTCTSCECCNDSPSLAIQRICYILPEKKNGSHSFVVDITFFLFDLPSWLNEWFESYRIILELLQVGSKRGRAFKVIHMDKGSLPRKTVTIFFKAFTFHLWPKKVVGLLGGSHDNWDHLRRSYHVEELLGYIVGTIVVLKSHVEPGKFRFNWRWLQVVNL